MTGILWRRLAQLHGVEYELLVGDSTEDALTAVRAALPSSPLTQLERGDLDHGRLRRGLCGDM